MRIYVEYDTTDPDLVRVQGRNAALAIVPAGSIAVIGWLVAGVALALTEWAERRYMTGGLTGVLIQDATSLSSQPSS